MTRIAERTFPLLYGLVTARAEEGWLGHRRAQLLGHATGTVLEIGAGLGASLRHYGEVDRIVLTEPSPFMRRRLNVEGATAPVEVVAAPAEALPAGRDTIDTVVSVCVLCTVRDVEAALSEIARVLRPDGRFLFLEHIRADGRAGWLQDRLNPVWRRAAAGCHLNRETLPAIEAAGLHLARLDRFVPPLPGGKLMPMIQGAATCEALRRTVQD
ncbi:MAG: class I SAM-dependent methyltransferase [Egibacteraceae bacterium]